MKFPIMQETRGRKRNEGVQTLGVPPPPPLEKVRSKTRGRAWMESDLIKEVCKSDWRHEPGKMEGRGCSEASWSKYKELVGSGLEPEP